MNIRLGGKDGHKKMKGKSECDYISSDGNI